jgi:hypothetical protein
MDIGIVGRHAHLLATAMETAARVGHAARGTLEDDDAIAWMREGAIQALVIGGGIEPPARRALLDACAAYGVRPIEIFGPSMLEGALQSLLR